VSPAAATPTVVPASSAEPSSAPGPTASRSTRAGTSPWPAGRRSIRSCRSCSPSTPRPRTTTCRCCWARSPTRPTEGA